MLKKPKLFLLFLLFFNSYFCLFLTKSPTFFKIKQTFCFSKVESKRSYSLYLSSLGFQKEDIFNILRTNSLLFIYGADLYDDVHVRFLYSFRNNLLKKGKNTSRTLFLFFLQFIKFNFMVNPIKLIEKIFLKIFSLPFKLYIVKLSNRNYYFPGPILSDKEQHSFLLKGFNSAITKQSDFKWINRFFLEFTAFLRQSTDSYLLNYLYQIVDVGMENRAFIHYRWLLYRPKY